MNSLLLKFTQLTFLCLLLDASLIQSLSLHSGPKIGWQPWQQRTAVRLGLCLGGRTIRTWWWVGWKGLYSRQWRDGRNQGHLVGLGVDMTDGYVILFSFRMWEKLYSHCCRNTWGRQNHLCVAPWTTCFPLSLWKSWVKLMLNMLQRIGNT